MGNKDNTEVILGDLSMEPKHIINNLKAVEETLTKHFKWATGKAGKASAKDKLNYVVSILRLRLNHTYFGKNQKNVRFTLCIKNFPSRIFHPGV